MGVHVVKLPDVGEGVAEAELVEWMVEIGAHVCEDQVLAAVMTDKATVEIPSPVEGRVIWQAGKAGETIAVGAPLIRLEVEGPGNVQPEKEPALFDASPEAAPAAQEDAETAKPLAAPAVRKRAADSGVDLRRVPGSGPAGRVTHRDLDAVLKSSGAGAAVAPGRDASVKEIQVIGLRRKIAEKMATANARIPHITYVEEIDVTALEDLREKLNETRSENRPKLTILPFLMRAMVEAIAELPHLNAHFDDDSGVIRAYGACHMGVATQTPNGLMVPVVRHAEARDIWDCAAEIRRLSEAARNGQAAREDLSGSTITITSLGALGGIVTTPIINHPEVAIIGVNKIQVLPRWDGTQFTPRRIMNLSSSFDHRVVDGWDAAQFVQRIKTLLESPEMIVVDG